MCDLSVEAPRWRHVQDADISRVSVPDAARSLPPKQLGFPICKCTLSLSPFLDVFWWSLFVWWWVLMSAFEATHAPLSFPLYSASLCTADILLSYECRTWQLWFCASEGVLCDQCGWLILVLQNIPTSEMEIFDFFFSLIYDQQHDPHLPEINSNTLIWQCDYRS